MRKDPIDYLFAASHLLDVMPNPWRGSELARRVFGNLLAKHSPEKVVSNYTFILESLRKRLEEECDRLARRVFSELLEAGTMRFLVVTDDLNFNRIPHAIETAPAKQANREDGGQYLLNLFERTGDDELNGLENKVATYLDQQERLFFWYRNRARRDYFIQGWKRGRIYADFVLTLRADEPDVEDEYHQVFVVENQGHALERIAGHRIQAVGVRHFAPSMRRRKTGRNSFPRCATRSCASKSLTKTNGRIASTPSSLPKRWRCG